MSKSLHPGRAGSAYFYDKGCRCDECRPAKMAKGRCARDRRRAANTPAYQRELVAARRRKESYRGSCERCGAATTGCDGPGSARTICVACAPAHYGPIYSAARMGHGPTIRRVLVLLAVDTPMRFSEIRDLAGLTNGHTANVLHRLTKYGLAERVGRGLYRKAAA